MGPSHVASSQVSGVNREPPGATMFVEEPLSTGASGGQPQSLVGWVMRNRPNILRAWENRLSEEGPSGSAGILPRVPSGGDRGGTGLCPLVQGDSAEVRSFMCGGDVEKRNKLTVERDIPVHVEQRVWGWWRGLGMRIVRLHGGYQRSDHSLGGTAPSRAEDGPRAA